MHLVYFNIIIYSSDDDSSKYQRKYGEAIQHRYDIKRPILFLEVICTQNLHFASSSTPRNICSGRTRKRKSHSKCMISKSAHDFILMCIQYCKPKTFRGDVNRMPETPWTKYSWQCSQGFRNYQIVVFFFLPLLSGHFPDNFNPVFLTPLDLRSPTTSFPHHQRPCEPHQSETLLGHSDWRTRRRRHLL